MISKKFLKCSAILGLSVFGTSVATYTHLHGFDDKSNVVLAESNNDGYSNVLNFTAKSSVSEDVTTKTTHKPMDLLLIVDFSGSLSDLMRNEAGYTGGVSIRKWQLNSMLSLVQNVVTNDDRISMAFYGGNLEDSYNIGNGPRGRITRLMTKNEVISTLQNLLEVPQLYDRKDGDVVLSKLNLPDYSREDGKPFEEAFDEMTRDKKSERVRSVLQYTDGWSSGETIDTSFAEWSKANAKTFMTVLNLDAYSGDNSSYDKLVKAGHPNIVKLNGTSGVSQSDIEKAFINTATEKIVNTTTTKQKGTVTITPDADLKLKSAELVAPNGSKTNLKIENNKVVWNGDLEDGGYKVNYTFEGKPSTERSVRSVVTVDGKKVDEKVNTIKPEKVPFETKYENDPSLESGVEKEKQAGIEGLRYVIVRDNKVVSNFVEKQKQDRIVLRGSKGSDSDNSTQKIPFETKYIEDDNLEVGKTRVVTEGVDGEKEIVKVYETQGGKRVGEPKVSERILKEKIDKVIAKGTKGSDVNTSQLDVPFKTIYKEDKELNFGEERVDVEGVVGKISKTETYVTKKGERVGEPIVSEKVTTEKVDKVVVRGTKPVVTTKDLDYKTKYVENKELEAKKKETKTEGKKGLETTTQIYSFNAETGEVTANEPKVEITDAVDDVIEVGTKPVVTTKDLDYKTKYVENKELEAKKKETKTEGKKGLEKITQTYSFNAETGEVTANEPKVETTDAVDEVIEVGTKPVVTTKDLDYKTERRENKKLDKGIEKVVQKGEKGLETTTQTYSFNPKTGEVTANKPEVKVKDAVNEIIEYGVREEKKLPSTSGGRLISLTIAGFSLVLAGISALAYKHFKK